MADDDSAPESGASGRTADVPGIGRVPRWGIYAAVGVAGIGVIWWWRSRSASTTAVDTTGDVGVGTYDPAPTGDATVAVDTTDPSAIDTVSEWTQEAVSLLGNVGVDPGAAAEALGLWLGHQPLTGPQKLIVIEARAIAGDPPVDPVPAMIDALPNPGGGSDDDGGESGGGDTTPTPVQHVTQAPVVNTTGHSSSAVSIAWGAVPGAVSYQVWYREGSTKATMAATPYTKHVDVSGTSYTHPAKAGWWYGLSVRGVASDGQAGPPPTNAQWIQAK